MTMNLHRLAATAALAVMSLHAHAVTTYTFGVDGTQTHFLDAWECPGSVCAPGTPLVVTNDWHATLTLTAPDGDGAFAFDWSGAEPNLKLALEQHGITTPFSFGMPPGPLFGAEVRGGQVVGLTGSGLLSGAPPGVWTFVGAGLSFDTPHQHHYGRTFGSGTLAVAPIPEPGTWALFAAGLFAVARITRKRVDA